MLRAVELSRRGLGQTSPNPPVGAVIVDANGAVVGEGWHERAGEAHAEVRALAAAGSQARGGTAVVTLEPCNHTGRTGPCTAALLAAGIRRVVVALRDPSPVAGGGVEVLRAAGVSVELGVESAAAQSVAGYWLTAVAQQRPFVTWKFAATLDGRSAAADGTSQWITDEPARQDVHRLRAEADTILVGVGTVLADNPALTVRLADFTGRQPRRVVVDSHGRTPAAYRDDHTWIATAAEVGAMSDGRVDLHKLLSRLYEQGSRAVLLEGGPRLAGGMIAAGLVHRVVGYLAPKLLGAGPTALVDAGISTIAAALPLAVTDIARVGADIRLVASIE